MKLTLISNGNVLKVYDDVEIGNNETSGELTVVTSRGSKVKTLAAVDVEKINKVSEFVDTVLTESRLNQGVEYLSEMGLDLDVKNIATFLRWVAGDVFKEENDTIVQNQLDAKLIGKQVSTEARKWFFTRLPAYA